MSARVFKYELEFLDQQVVHLPVGSVPLSVANQRERLVLYALVGDDAPTFSGRTFYVHGTGHPVIDERATFLGTVKFAGGELMFHVFCER